MTSLDYQLKLLLALCLSFCKGLQRCLCGFWVEPVDFIDVQLEYVLAWRFLKWRDVALVC